jgi:hypothetical protein
MTELRGFDFDGETSRAWRAFAGRLADHLADMEEGDTLEIGLVGLPAEAPGSRASAVHFVGCEGTLVRAEVTVTRGDTVNRDEATGPSSDEQPAVEDLLAELGWHPLEPAPRRSAGAGGGWVTEQPTYVADQTVPRREADALSSRTVRLLCEVLGAVHPVFLRVSGDHDLVDRSPEGYPIADVLDLQFPGVTEPTDSAHLRELVTQTMTAHLGAEPIVDDDGDITIDAGTTRVFIRVLETTPAISVFGRLVHAVTHPYEAPAVVAKLNADYSFVKFIFGRDSVVACVHLPANPFVAAQLRRMVATFSELADALDDELVRRLGGRREIEAEAEQESEAAAPEDPDDEPDAVPPELRTLLQLDPDGVGLDAVVTAEVCGYDRALTRQLLHIADGQEAAWRASVDDESEPAQERARSAEEADGWSAMKLSLAGALELIDACDD